MASPEVLDFAKLLAPIPGENPAGGDLRADPSPNSVYYLIKDARNKARAAERQMVVEGEESGGEPPDWRPVLQHGTKALGEKTKDLEVAAYMIEALVRLKGFAGLRDGFRLARELVEKFWDKLYPLPDEEGIDTRVAPLTGLNGDDAEGTLIAPIIRVPVTDVTGNGTFSVAQYQSALALAKITDPKAREQRIKSGAVELEKVQQAVTETQPKFYLELVQDLTQSIDEFGKLCAALDKRCEGRAPPASNIRGSLVVFQDAVKDLARAKLEAAAPPKEAAPGAPAAPGAAAQGAAAPGEALDVLRTREDAFRALLKVAEFFRKTEPHSVISYTLEQVVRWGRMPLPELMQELLPDEPRKGFFKQVGIKPPEQPKKT